MTRAVTKATKNDDEQGSHRPESAPVQHRRARPGGAESSLRCPDEAAAWPDWSHLRRREELRGAVRASPCSSVVRASCWMLAWERDIVERGGLRLPGVGQPIRARRPVSSRSWRSSGAVDERPAVTRNRVTGCNLVRSRFEKSTDVMSGFCAASAATEVSVGRRTCRPRSGSWHR